MKDLLSDIKNLRDKTGAGFLDCKKALEANDHNIENAIFFLRKKGLAKASKKSSREANEGAIGLYSNKKITALIEINTETDFAAKNKVFLDFMDLIGSFVLEVNKVNITIEEFKNLSFNKMNISDYLTDTISKIGENIVLNKLIIITNDQNSSISSYIHNSYRKNIGKICVILKYQVNKLSEEALTLSKNLCMHIAACKPSAMDIDNLDKELIAKEREVQLATIKSSGKPSNIIDKILDGKMKKYYSEITLFNQSYILDPDKNIKQVIADFSKLNNYNILDYKLAVLGS